LRAFEESVMEAMRTSGDEELAIENLHLLLDRGFPQRDVDNLAVTFSLSYAQSGLNGASEEGVSLSVPARLRRSVSSGALVRRLGLHNYTAIVTALNHEVLWPPPTQPPSGESKRQADVLSARCPVRSVGVYSTWVLVRSIAWLIALALVLWAGMWECWNAPRGSNVATQYLYLWSLLFSMCLYKIVPLVFLAGAAVRFLQGDTYGSYTEQDSFLCHELSGSSVKESWIQTETLQLLNLCFIIMSCLCTGGELLFETMFITTITTQLYLQVW
jgi:hypothetical protein